jgi:Protein of unknown function (DUF541)
VTVPTLFVTGSAERDVTPDLVVVWVSVQAPVMPTPQAALSHAAEARRRLLDHLEAALADVAISDGRVTEHGPPSQRSPDFEHAPYSQMSLADMSPDELEETLGELRPDPERRAAEVPVRLELREAGGGGPAA